MIDVGDDPRALFIAAYGLRLRAGVLLDAGHSIIGAELLRQSRQLHAAGLRVLADCMTVPA